MCVCMYAVLELANNQWGGGDNKWHLVLQIFLGCVIADWREGGSARKCSSNHRGGE